MANYVCMYVIFNDLMTYTSGSYGQGLFEKTWVFGQKIPFIVQQFLLNSINFLQRFSNLMTTASKKYINRWS